MNEESEDSYIGSGPSILAMTSLHTNQVVVLSTRVVVLQQGDFSLWSIDTSRVWLVFFFPPVTGNAYVYVLTRRQLQQRFDELPTNSDIPTLRGD